MKSQSGRYAQKIAALQQANAEDLKKDLTSNSSRPGFVPPMYLNLEGLKSPRTALSKLKTGSLQEPMTENELSTANTLKLSSPIRLVNVINSSPVKNKDEIYKETSMQAEPSGSKTEDTNQNTSGITLSQLGHENYSKPVEGGTTTLQIHYVTTEDRAPFEIKPIPGKVSVDTKSEVNGKFVCQVCNKTFDKQHQLTLHKNVHFLNAQIRCEDCNITFQNMSNLVKHKKSESHIAKASLNEQAGGSLSQEPRPFKCDDCNISFRLHGHLLRHFRSKTHISTLEALDKLPSGTFGELDGPSLMYIDVSDPQSVISSIKQLLKGEIPKSAYKDVPAEEQRDRHENNTTSQSEELSRSQYESSVLTSNENVTVEVINRAPAVLFQPVKGSKGKTDTDSSNKANGMNC